MALDRITLQRDQVAAIECAELRSYILQLRAAYELGSRIRAKMQHNFVANANANLIDWAALQTLWGIPVIGANSTGPTASGAIVYTYLDGSVGSMEGAFQTNAAKEITERVG